MKKRLIFVNNNLHSGGIQKSLLSLLSHIKDQYAVTLLLMSDTGEYKAQLSKGIQVLHCSPILRLSLIHIYPGHGKQEWRMMNNVGL